MIRNPSPQEALAILRELPRPTAEQIERFIEYVKSRRSWYKHLPVLQGHWFVFYLNPAAGYYYHNNELKPEESTHHVLTPERRVLECGYLEFARLGDAPQEELGYPLFSMREANGDYRVFRLPDPLRGTGAVRLNALIRSCMGVGSIWSQQLRMELRHPPEKVEWPAEAGGSAALEALAALIEKGKARDEEIWEPAVRHQQHIMRQAIQQMLDYIYEGKTPDKTWLE